jgi:regulator of sigma E protease
MLAYLAPVLVFGLVIFIHELGHFMAAKLTGVYAPRFSIGFGPALFRRRRGETEYVLSVLPLGGFVRMASRLDADTAAMEGGPETEGLKPGDAGYDPNAMMPFGPHPVPENRWFESKSLAARLFIMLAGVTMNIILAFAIFSTVFATHGQQLIASRVVGDVGVVAGAPSLAQLRESDTITAIGAHPVAHWNDVIEQILGAPAGVVVIHTTRGAVTVPVGTPGAPSAEQIARAVDFYRSPVIGQVLAGGPALRAGLLAGDTIVAISGEPVRTWQQMVKHVSAAPNIDLPFEIRRGGRTLSITVRPQATAETDSLTHAPRTVGRIGAAYLAVTEGRRLGVLEGIKAGARQTVSVAAGVVDVVKKLFTAKVSVRELGGPIAITRASVSAGQGGLVEIFLLIALISVNVAVLNLLPIPILDGGQMLMNIAETVKGSAFSMRTREYIMRAGLLAILIIFAMSTFNDVVRLVKDYGGRFFG